MDSPAPFVSIQLNSNRPAQLALFFDSIEATAAQPGQIEVLLHIDEGDHAMAQAAAREISRRRFTLRILTTDLVKGYATLWQPLNPLFAMTHPEAYFVINVSDEFLFLTQGWDTIIRQYAGYYPDHIFRLRASQFRFRNYTDFWECGSAPDSIAFYTRRWLELSGDWCPCLGPDSFQQSVAFYLYACEPQFCRDIAVRELRFSGEGAGLGLSGEAQTKRALINTRAWFTLMSHRMQEEAKRRAMRLKSHIVAGIRQAEITEEPARKRFVLRQKDSGAPADVLSYRLSWWRVTLTNISRMPLVRYYGGYDTRSIDGCLRSILLMCMAYRPALGRALHPLLEKILRRFTTLKNARTQGREKQERSVTAKPFNGSDNIAKPVPMPAAAGAPTVFSFHLPALSFPQLTALLDNIEATARHPEYVEALVPAQADGILLREQERRKLRLRFVKPGAAVPLAATHPQAYFVAFLNADTRFETQGWDAILVGYLGAFPDHIFRLRLSPVRFHNYTSIRECIAAPDRLPLYTRRWLAVQGDTGPHADIAAFQQCVSYYLFTSDPFSQAQTYREMAVPFLAFSGEPPTTQASGTLLSAEVQLEARRRAMQLKAAIVYQACLAQLPDKPLVLLDDASRQTIEVRSPSGAPIKILSYRKAFA